MPIYSIDNSINWPFPRTPFCALHETFHSYRERMAFITRNVHYWINEL